MSHWESNGRSDEWYTPKYVFDALGCSFDQDVAAPRDRTFCSVPTDNFITENSLDLEWNGFVWTNPPFGKRNSISDWLDKIHHHGEGIALVPDRTSCPWWQKAGKQADSVLFVDGKIKFLRPDGSTGDQPSNGTTLFGYGDYARKVLRYAEIMKLGIYYER